MTDQLDYWKHSVANFNVYDFYDNFVNLLIIYMFGIPLISETVKVNNWGLVSSLPKQLLGPKLEGV